MGSGSGLACDITLNSKLTPEMRVRYQDSAVVRSTLGRARAVAIVGLSANPRKASHFVGTYLKYHGYRVVPVNPGAAEILGNQSFPDLASIPFPIDVVNVFRPASACPEIAEEAVRIGATTLWLQLTIVSPEAAEIAEKGGLKVVMDRCMKMEHGRYDGSMHWVGMNTGIISAKKARRWF